MGMPNSAPAIPQSDRRRIDSIFPRLVVTAGIIVTVAALLNAMIATGTAGRTAAAAVPLLALVAALKLAGIDIELRVFDSLYPAYRYALTMLGLLFGLALALPVTMSVYGAMLLVYLALLSGRLSGGTRGILRVLPGAFILPAVLHGGYEGLDQAYIGHSILCATGIFILLYGVQYQTRKEYVPAALKCDAVEIMILVLLFAALPALIAYAVAWPLAGYFARVRGQFVVIEGAAGPGLSEEFGWLLVDTGILVVLLVLLAVVWRKLRRSREGQKPLAEAALESFGHSQPLALERKHKRRTGSAHRGLVLAAYYGLVDCLEGLGLPHPPAMTPEEFADTAGRRMAPAEGMHRITGLFMAARFSRREIVPAEADRARSLAAELARAAEKRHHDN
ncbi:MAG: DUF4129 domain-containing protein [Planctomycetota bacterium]